MNTTNYAVIVNEKAGGMPSCISKNSPFYWDFMNSGYIHLNEGTRAECESYLEQYMEQLNEIEYFELRN